MEKSMIFYDNEINTTLGGGMTMFVRPLNYQPLDILPMKVPDEWVTLDTVNPNHGKVIGCRFGIPGDRLWVKETWADVNSEYGPAICYKADGSLQSWRDFSKVFGPDEGAGPSMDYETYPGNYFMWWEDLLMGHPGHGWRPSVHMPRWASRITLEVVNVRVMRVQDITEEDAKTAAAPLGRVMGYGHVGMQSHLEGFIELWDSRFGKKYPWRKNPWVWITEFKCLTGIEK